MTQALHDAATTLATILAEENIALASLDLAGAARLTAAKRRATDAFTTAHARLAAMASPSGGPSGSPALAADLTTSLRDLAAENRALLDRALATQARVLDIIAQAVPRASAQAPRYCATATLVGRGRALPVAITASA